MRRFSNRRSGSLSCQPDDREWTHLFYRLFLLFLISYFLFRALRSLFRRKPLKHRMEGNPGTGVDPRSIRDAEFTEVQDTDEGKK